MNYAESRRMSSLSRLSSRELSVSLPDLEMREPLLWQMLIAGAFLDDSLREELRDREGEPACGPGCAACCCQPVPLSLAEGLAIHAFLRLARLPLPERAISGDPDECRNGVRSTACGKKEGARSDARAEKCPGGNRNSSRCPFLRDGRCVVYPARPFACRRFIVFGAPCSRDEDPTLTRPGDVFEPSPQKLFAALCLTLPIYQRLAVPVPETVTRRFFNDHTCMIQAFPWHKQ